MVYLMKLNLRKICLQWEMPRIIWVMTQWVAVLLMQEWVATQWQGVHLLMAVWAVTQWEAVLLMQEWVELNKEELKDKV
jgi:hypothetical protein